MDVRQVEALEELGLESPGLRYGMELTVESPFGPVNLLNVHMKSGCFVDDFSRSDDEDCLTFAEQAPILDGWIEEQERGSVPYLVLGDFNHRLSAPYNRLTRLLGDNSDGSSSTLVMPTASIIGCHPWYPAPIDHILAGKFQAPTMTLTPVVHPFQDMDPDAMLSDHCAVSVTLSHAPLPLSNSVTWQTTSKEYRYLTTSIYNAAAEDLRGMTLPTEPWVVAMDIDETVLDNSTYQVKVDQTGQPFTPESWADWVASEQATLVPGVAEFIQTVVDMGGRLAFVTNRDRPQDNHTWSNLMALGLPIAADNTCLMGRSSADRESVDDSTYINDKDLRRRQIENGSASCYDPSGGRHSTFPAATIVMQVGDNIEDFAGVTQESADIAALQDQEAPLKVLLPNPMYGSW
ncbi:MAG: endonuclease/exonuclease/phosphatase [Bacteroidetes bacterium]|nr:endonuclease/exonuclease/phosphatase [Bacteroidota bacterium]